VNLSTDMTINLSLTRREFVLVTKALTGRLREDEVLEARTFGLDVMSAYCLHLGEKNQAADHALEKAKEPVPMCGACGLESGPAYPREPSVKLREDGTVRCNDCWEKEKGKR